MGEAMEVVGLEEELRRLPEVRLAWCFGSRARGEARGDSDWDVAVLLEHAALERSGEVGMIRRLAGRLGRRVPSTRLDLVILNQAPPLLRHRVLRDGRLLFARSEQDRVRFVRRTLREVQDFALRREMHTRARIRRIKGRTGDGGSGDLLAQARRAAELLGQARRVREVDEDEFVANPALHDLAERYLHLAMEAVLDLVNHWIADRALGTPETNRDAFTVLEKGGELSPQLAEALRGWAGFRNILVHEYLSIDHAISYRAIREELEDLEAVFRWAGAKLG